MPSQIDLSGGTPLLGGERAGPAEALALAKALVRESDSPGPAPQDSRSSGAFASSVCPRVALGGGILDGAGAEALLREGHASLVSVGRPLLADPYWPVRAALEVGARAPVPWAYAEALNDGSHISPRAFGGAVSSPDRSKHVDDCTKV
jgi:2,4-dienoyl-CoA reductase-like NADH-dependent reductase (Old Yellow Enzyme family)